MNKFEYALKKYFRDTHTLLYSYLIALPLLFLYEALIYISKPENGFVVRASVDLWFKSLLSTLGYNVISVTLVIVALLGIAILYIERRRLSSLKLRNFIFMLAESVCYAFLLALFLGTIITLLFQIIVPSNIHELSFLQKIALSLGAGLYEELFFRVILVSGLFYFFTLFAKNNAAFLLSVIIAALMFSAIHYFGALGDVFTASSFLFRFLFGVALNIIYLKRGFGIAAWAHASYDIMIVIYT